MGKNEMVFLLANNANALYTYFHKYRNNRIEVLNVYDEIAVKVYKALGEPTRLQIVNKLANLPEMACNEIVDELDINSNSTLTHHLKLLIDCGLLVVKKEGTYRYYSLQRDVLEKYAPTLIPD
ncbi:metalloregulator ArsR/SmtB family transcription factor (plasmid) [Niallia sp. XMNu-256]|uniref:ArsR/SmtB family transcription factor n=1 Tax=Niallia sp. XMNu-256 TaxID=3082444 RepID=UPI0030CE5B66